MDVGRPRDRARVKETDEVKLLQFPHGAAWRAWRASTIHAVISAAGRQDDLAQEWILKVETHDPSDSEGPGEGWISLDRKLAAALTKIARGEIGRHITQATTIALNNNMVATGSRTSVGFPLAEDIARYKRAKYLGSPDYSFEWLWEA